MRLIGMQTASNDGRLCYITEAPVRLPDSHVYALWP